MFNKITKIQNNNNKAITTNRIILLEIIVIIFRTFLKALIKAIKLIKYNINLF
jgi:hypothetical protein